jgi:hypothetical protein
LKSLRKEIGMVKKEAVKIGEELTRRVDDVQRQERQNKSNSQNVKSVTWLILEIIDHFKFPALSMLSELAFATGVISVTRGVIET